MQSDPVNPELSTLFTAALLIAGSPEAAEDLVVQAYEATTSQASLIKSKTRLETLMHEMVSAARRLSHGESEGGQAIPVSEPGDQPGFVRKSLGYLDINQRAAVVLRDVTGFSRSEAARVLGTTPERFRQLLSEGRLTMAERMT